MSQWTNFDDFFGQYHAFTCVDWYHDDQISPGIDCEGANGRILIKTLNQENSTVFDWKNYHTYDPHSSALDKIIILKITTKFIYKISKSLNNQMKITTPSIIFKKKIPKILPFSIGNEDRMMKKGWKNQATLSPFIPHPPLNLAMHHKNAWNFLWWYFLPITRLLAKK